MSLQSLWLAMRFLTRLPTPRAGNFPQRDLSRAAAWFPLIGALIGMFVVLIMLLARNQSPLLAAVLGVLAWVWITGALHLDGLADLTDALAASHRNPERFATVLADPHVGTFAVVGIVLILLVKTAALAQLSNTALLAVPLVPAWARLGPLAWSRWLGSLKEGHARDFAEHLSTGWILFWTALLLLASAALAPWLSIAPLALAAWGVWLHFRLGGVTGDCLGAGVEVTEMALLLVLACAHGAPALHCWI